MATVPPAGVGGQYSPPAHRADARFHRALAEAAGNPTLVETLEGRASLLVACGDGAPLQRRGQGGG